MGNLHSIITGFFSRDEEEGGAVTPSLRPWQCRNGILSYDIAGYKAIKGLFRFIISILWWPRKRISDDPILPIENPRSAPISNGNGYDTTSLVEPFLDSYFHECDDDIVEAHASPQDKIIFIPDSVSEEAYEEEGDHITVRMSSTLERIWFEANASPHDEIIFVPDSVSNEVEDEREDKTVIISSVERIMWIKHYSSSHQILLVGDGDFSFSAALAVAFGRASNMIATSLDSEAFLEKNYRKAMFNITELRKRGCKVMHGINATEIAGHAALGHLKFERIIYNFPHAGFFNNLSRDIQLRRHRRLVSRFLKNAREMMSENGEIHISHKTNGFHTEWKLESLASCHGLRLIEAVKFNRLDYPGYHTKYGFGGDNNFNCNPSKTYKFGFKTLGHYV